MGSQPSGSPRGIKAGPLARTTFRGRSSAGGPPRDRMARSPRVDMSHARDRWVALSLLCLAAGAYALGFQDWVYGDGPQLIDAFLFLRNLWMHVLYIPAARVLGLFWWGADPVDPLRATSILGAAAGVSGTYLLARWFGCEPVRALLAALLAATVPAVTFFATTIEVHALHFGTVALAAWALTRVPWNDPRIAVALSSALVPLLYLTHKSGVLLAPGWLALALLVRHRAGRAPDVRTALLLGTGIALAFLGSLALSSALLPDRNSIGGTLDFIAHFQRTAPAGFLHEAVLVGLAALTPLALLGALRVSRAELLVLAAFLLPLFGFFCWYGEATRGGYFASAIPFLAVLAARALPAGIGGIGLATVALGLQAFVSARQARDYASEFSWEDRRARCAAVRSVLGEQGTLLSFDPTLQPVTLDLSGVREVNARSDLMRTTKNGMAPAASAQITVDFLRKLMDRWPGPFALDPVLTRRAGLEDELAPFRAAIEDAVTAAFQARLVPDPRFPLLRLR